MKLLLQKLGTLLKLRSKVSEKKSSILEIKIKLNKEINQKFSRSIEINSDYSDEDAKSLAYLLFSMENKLVSDEIIEKIVSEDEKFTENVIKILDIFDSKLQDAENQSEYEPAISPLHVMK